MLEYLFGFFISIGEDVNLLVNVHRLISLFSISTCVMEILIKRLKKWYWLKPNSVMYWLKLVMNILYL